MADTWCLTAPTPASFKEEQVKAAFIYNFVKFVEWPAEKLSDPRAPIVIGVVGKGLFCGELTTAVKGRQVGEHPLAVEAVDNLDAARRVHVLVIERDETEQLPVWLAECAKANVLTIGESDAFANQGGVIRFVWQGDRLRFEINMGAADGAKLKISAQLQKLATTVKKRL